MYTKLLEHDKEAQNNDSGDEQAENKYLIIDSFCEINEYDRTSEIASITRPNILVLLSIICFVTDVPLTTFGFFTTFYKVVENAVSTSNATVLIIDEKNYSAVLKDLLDAMKDYLQRSSG